MNKYNVIIEELEEEQGTDVKENDENLFKIIGKFREKREQETLSNIIEKFEITIKEYDGVGERIQKEIDKLKEKREQEKSQKEYEEKEMEIEKEIENFEITIKEQDGVGERIQKEIDRLYRKVF